MAGLSGGFLGHQILDDLTLDDPCIRSHGSFLGAGGIMVFDDSRNMMKAAHDAMLSSHTNPAASVSLVASALNDSPSA